MFYEKPKDVKVRACDNRECEASLEYQIWDSFLGYYYCLICDWCNNYKKEEAC